MAEEFDAVDRRGFFAAREAVEDSTQRALDQRRQRHRLGAIVIATGRSDRAAAIRRLCGSMQFLDARLD
jgi:hypothetical protein